LRNYLTRAKVLLEWATGNTYPMLPTEFHPELRRAARYIPKQIVTPVTVPFIRAAERLLWRGTPDDIEVLTLPSGAGVRPFRPAGGTGRAPALLWIHGGGYVIGRAAQDDA
jgi:acetyl esterase/lipase